MSFSKRKMSPLSMKGGGLTDAISTEWSNLSSVFKPLLIEIFRLFPDSILFGSFFFALVSQSYPMSIFVVSMLETSAIAGLLQKLMTYLDFARSLPNLNEDPSKCYPSALSPSLESLLRFNQDSLSSAFPSFPIFFISTASAYVVGSVWAQKRELEALGPEYAARFYIAIAITTLLLFTSIAFRLSYGCEGVGTLLVTTLFGLVLGGLLIFQNNSLLGRDSTNFSGIPLLRERTKDGKPLYVCTGRTKD